MFHNGKKRKPLNCLFYWCWPVIATINTIDFFFRGFIQVSVNISFVICSINIKSPLLKKCWMVYFLDYGCNICTKYVDYLFLSIIESFLDIVRTRTCIYKQVLQCIWIGKNCGRKYHDFVWIICYFCINYVFYLRWKFF